MGKLSLLVLVVAALYGKLAAEDAAIEKKLETKTEDKEETVAKLEPSPDNVSEDRRAYNVNGYLAPGQPPNPNAAKAQAEASANGYVPNPAYPYPANPAYPPVNPNPTVGPRPPNGMVECYSCTDCPHVTKDTPTKSCPASFDPAKSGRCVMYATKYGQLKKQWHIRGCASDVGLCQDVKNGVNKYPDPGSLMFCKECDSNLCNAGEVTRSLPAFGMASLAVVIIPLLKNKLLS